MLRRLEAKGLVQTTSRAALDVVLTKGVHDDLDGEGVSQEGIGDQRSPDAASPSRRPNREPGDLRVWRDSEERECRPSSRYAPLLLAARSFVPFSVADQIVETSLTIKGLLYK